MAKQITIQCPRDIAGFIIEALQWFVQSHYPYSGDECSTAAREALLDLVDRFRRELLVDGCSHYSMRIRAFLCEAVKGYTAVQEQAGGDSWASRRELIIRVCRGESDGAGYDAAARQDAHAPASGAAQ